MMIAGRRSRGAEGPGGQARSPAACPAARPHRADARHLGDDAAEWAAAARWRAAEIHDDWTVGWALHVLTLVAMTREKMDEALRLFDRALLSLGRSGPDGPTTAAAAQQAVALSEMIATMPRRRPGGAAPVDPRWQRVRLTQAHATLGRHLLATGQWDDALSR
jgi:hypothetical protein